MTNKYNLNNEDTLFNEALAFVASTQQVSITSVQRKLDIGYNKAACLVLKMEEEKYITPPLYNGKRSVLINRKFKKSVLNYVKYKTLQTFFYLKENL